MVIVGPPLNPELVAPTPPLPRVSVRTTQGDREKRPLHLPQATGVHSLEERLSEEIRETSRRAARRGRPRRRGPKSNVYIYLKATPGRPIPSTGTRLDPACCTGVDRAGTGSSNVCREERGESSGGDPGPANSQVARHKLGAGEEDRTLDIQLGKLTLYR